MVWRLTSILYALTRTEPLVIALLIGYYRGYITLPLLNYFIPQQGYSSTVPINQSNQLNGMEQVVIHGSQKIPHNPLV